MANSTLRRYPADVARAFGHAPLEVAYALLLAAGFSWAVEIDQASAFRAWWEWALVLGLAGAAAWGATLLHALGAWSLRRRQVVSVTGAALAAILALAFLDVEREAEVWRAGTLLVAAVLAVLAAPALAGAEQGARRAFRRVNGRFLLRAVGAGLYAGALFLGLVLAIAAVDNLFELDLDERIFGHVFGWIALAVAPWILVGGLPDFVRPLDEESETLSVVHRVSAWLVLPLLAVYYLILYAYSVRILALGELPRNMVSPLVTTAGILTALALVLFDRGPGEDPGGPGSRAPALRVLRLAPVLFLPLAALGVYAVAVRVGQYGWTEFRYLRVSLLVGLALLAAGATVQLVLRRSFRVQAVPVGIALVLAVSAVGPWSAMAVSRRSQQERMASALDRAGLLRDGRVAVDTAGAPRRVPAEVHDAIVSTSRYLVRHFGVEAVSPPLPEGSLGEEPEVRNLPSVLGLERIAPEGLHVSRGAALGAGTPVELEGSSLLRVELRRSRGPGEGNAVVRDSFRLAVTTGRGILIADLRALVEWLAAQGAEGPAVDLPPGRAVVPLVDARGEPGGSLVIFSIYVAGDGEELPLRNLEAVAVLPAASNLP